MNQGTKKRGRPRKAILSDEKRHVFVDADITPAIPVPAFMVSEETCLKREKTAAETAVREFANRVEDQLAEIERQHAELAHFWEEAGLVQARLVRDSIETIMLEMGYHPALDL
jgi:hypothetical protein